MFKKVYKIAIDGKNSTEAFNALLDVFNVYGKVLNVTENPLMDTKTNKEVYKVYVYSVKATKKKFDRLVKTMREAGHPLHYIKGVWFM